jgi:hypothetical protein
MNGCFFVLRYGRGDFIKMYETWGCLWTAGLQFDAMLCRYVDTFARMCTLRTHRPTRAHTHTHTHTHTYTLTRTHTHTHSHTQGWWAGKADGDPLGHLLHIAPEFGRWTGRAYTASDLATMSGEHARSSILGPLFKIFYIIHHPLRCWTVSTPALASMSIHYSCHRGEQATSCSARSSFDRPTAALWKVSM